MQPAMSNPVLTAAILRKIHAHLCNKLRVAIDFEGLSNHRWDEPELAEAKTEVIFELEDNFGVMCPSDHLLGETIGELAQVVAQLIEHEVSA